MKDIGLFEILGPVMIGPSSSHTAGAVRLGNLAALIFNRQINRADFFLHGSFAKTHRGHGTDLALVAGIMGFATDDARIIQSFDLASQQGIAFSFHEEDLGYVHPNTVRVVFNDSFSVTASSIGGGRVEIIDIDGTQVLLSGDYPTLVLQYEDKMGMIEIIGGLMVGTGANIASMKVTRSRKKATMVLELDARISQETFRALEGLNLDYLASIGALEEE